MKTLFKALLLGIFLTTHSPIYSEDISAKCCSKKFKKQLENSVWIVPPSTLRAYEYLEGDFVPVSDQTVWVITHYDQGYFFGKAYTALNGSPSSQKTILGSVTPCGAVYMTFFPPDENVDDTDIINGIGTFKKHKKDYYFTMQMNSAQNSLDGLAHWSYMISVEPTDYFYQHLPGLDISVPDFISQF